MKIVKIEVSPRLQDNKYHACLAGDVTNWGCGKSIEEAVTGLIRTYHDVLDLTINEMPAQLVDFPRMDLKNLIKLLNQKKINLQIIFLPSEIR